jgi:tyrosine-protein phosphatase YwqE
MGYRKLITTPHVMGDFYKNTPEIILGKLDQLRTRIANEGIEIELHAAAEYYLDESLIGKLKKGEQLLTIGENYLLFETSYLNEPANLFEAIALIKQSGYWPVLAHPERYQYLYRSFEKFEEIYEQQLSFQLNTNSLLGYYSKPAQVFAQKLIEKNMISFAGSDCHHMKHLEALQKTIKLKEYKELCRLHLFNNSLL